MINVAVSFLQIYKPRIFYSFCLLAFNASEISFILMSDCQIGFKGIFQRSNFQITPNYSQGNFDSNFLNKNSGKLLNNLHKMPPTKHPLQLLPISFISSLLFSLATSAVVAVVGWQNFYFPLHFLINKRTQLSLLC